MVRGWSVMRRFVRRAFVGAIVPLSVCIGLAGCLSPDVAMSHRGAQKPHVTIRDPQTGEVVAELTKVQLQNRLFDLCDLWASMIKGQFDPLVDETTDPDVRSSLIEQKMRAIVSGYTIGVTSDPVSGMLDMMVLSRLLAQTWQPGPRVTDYFGDEAPRVSAVFAAAEVKVWNIAGGLLNTHEREQLLQRIDEWIKDSPDVKSVSFARLSDIDAGFDARLEASVAKSQGLMDVLDEAMRSAEEFRLLGERSLWLASRAPVLVRMTTEASVVSAFDIPQVQEMLKASKDLPVAVERLAGQVHDAAEEIEKQRREVFASIDAAKGSIDPMIDKLREVAQIAQHVVAQAKQLADERSEIAQSAVVASRDLREALTTLDAMAKRFYPEGSAKAGSGPGQMAADLSQAATKFDSAVLTLQGLLKSGDGSDSVSELSKLADSKVAELANSGNAAIDRAFWRGVLLVVIAFVLAVVYKAISVRMVARG